MNYSQLVRIDGTNWRGEKYVNRRIMPKSIYFGKNEWHPEEQWLLLALDVERADNRVFALKDITKWVPVEVKDGVVVEPPGIEVD